MGKLSSFATDFANSSLKTHPLTVPTTPLKKSSKKSGISVPEWLGKSIELADDFGTHTAPKAKINVSAINLLITITTPYSKTQRERLAH
jgi:hypothetical protein